MTTPDPGPRRPAPQRHAAISHAHRANAAAESGPSRIHGFAHPYERRRLGLSLWLSLLGLAVVGVPAANATPQVAEHTYDLRPVAVVQSLTTTERGPPTSYDSPTCTYGSTSPSCRTHNDPAFRQERPAIVGNGAAGSPLSFSRLGVAANSGNRVFWSGGSTAKEAAAEFAAANGAKTLEMTAVGRTLERLPYNRATAKLWDAASAGFAATARGEANVFIGPTFRGSESVFGRIEGPILNFKGNPILQRFEDAW